MMKILLAALIAGATLTASAQSPARQMKQLQKTPASTIKVKTNKSRAAEVLPEGKVMFESFEGWDGSTWDWTPEGWSVEMRGENQDRKNSWTPAGLNPYLPAAYDGKYYYAINYARIAQDEWLISPEVTVEDGMIASFAVFCQAPYLFVMNQETFDYDNMEFIGEKKIAATLQLWVQPEGEEWQQIYDLSDEYKDMTYMEMVYSQIDGDLQFHAAPLGEFIGKKIKLGLRYAGIDGDLMLIDAIGVGYPTLDNVSYDEPWSVLYWGMDRSEYMGSTAAPIAQYPVFEPLTWTNSSYDGDEYSWEYDDPEHKSGVLTSTNADELTLTYLPDYSSALTKKNNFHNPHRLNASAPKATPTTFTAPYLCLQAGGKAEITFNDGTEFDGCLLPFAHQNLGLKSIYCEDTEAGVLGIPVFGYDPLGTVDDYWLKYSLNGEEKIEGDYSRLTAFGNLFMPSAAPLVVNGLTLYAYGQLEADAEIRATIYGLNAEMNSDISTFTTIATTTCKGSDIKTLFPDQRGDMVLPFDFDEPVVLKATQTHPAYMIMIEDFRSDKVLYLAPRQSATPDYINWGYIVNDINLEAHNGRPAYTNVKPMVYKSDINNPNSYVDPYAAFAIGLNAEYPWLTCDVESVAFEGETTVALGSYYDGSRLTVEAPEGIDATVSGRYDECVLTMNATAAVEGKVTVSGPGVGINFDIKAAQAGIHEVESIQSADEPIYDLQGRRAANPGKGIYVSKGKVVVR